MQLVHLQRNGLQFQLSVLCRARRSLIASEKSDLFAFFSCVRTLSQMSRVPLFIYLFIYLFTHSFIYLLYFRLMPKSH